MEKFYFFCSHPVHSGYPMRDIEHIFMKADSPGNALRKMIDDTPVYHCDLITEAYAKLKSDYHLYNDNIDPMYEQIILIMTDKFPDRIFDIRDAVIQLGECELIGIWKEVCDTEDNRDRNKIFEEVIEMIKEKCDDFAEIFNDFGYSEVVILKEIPFII